MLSLAIWLAILWACYGAGARILERLRAGAGTVAEEFPFAAALGMGLLAYLLLAVGLLHWLSPWVGIGLVALLAALGARHMVRLLLTLLSPRSWNIDWRAAAPLLGFFAAAIAITLIGALAPATDNDYDGLFYHLAIPKVYLRDGGIHPIPWLSHSNFPFTLEMLYMLGLMLRGQVLAKLFHFGAGWLTALALFAFGRRWWSARAGAIAAALFAAIPLVAWLMMSAYNELAFALFAFLAIFALARSRQAEEGGWLWVAALMCGLALGTKMLAGAVVVFGVLALVWAAVWEHLGRRGLVRVVGFAAVAAAVAAPWYVKSYLWTGNPVYPFFYGLFDGRWWNAQHAREYAQAQKAFGMGAGPLAFLALPWNLTMNPRWFFDQPNVLRPFNTWVMVFGPLLLALVPAVLVVGPVGAAGRIALSFSLVYAAIWFVMTQNGRYLVPALPPLCAVGGLAADRLLDRKGAATSATVVALLLGLTSGLWAGYLLARPAAPVALGRESQAAYLARVFPLYSSLDEINRLTPPNARILVLGDEPRLFYLDRDYLLGNHADIFSAEDLSSPGALLAAFDRMGITYVLLHSSTLRDMAAGAGRIETDLHALATEGSLRLIQEVGPFTLWQVVAEPTRKAG